MLRKPNLGAHNRGRCPYVCGLYTPWAMEFQRENRNLSLVEAGAETPVLGSKGQRIAPFGRWGSRGRAKSPAGRDETPKSFSQPRRTIGPDVAEQSLSEDRRGATLSLGIPWGVRGGWEIPPQGERGGDQNGTTAHTLCLLLSQLAPKLRINPRSY